ncbi:ribonuclease H-like domain-containing protein [Tanacetum coccineum]
MTTVNQGMSVEEIERVVAQRVDNAIEAIAIYETKTNMAHKSMSQAKRQENKCGNCKKVGHIIQNCKTPATTKNQQTCTCYECGSLRHYKSECPIVKFHKRVDMIYGGVRASKPNIMQDAIEFVTKLMDKKISTPAERQAENKRGRHGEKKHYGGSKPLCSKCNYHHDGLCAPKCHKNDCPERNNQNHENQTGGTRERGVVHAFGGGETEQDLNNIEDEIDA